MKIGLHVPLWQRPNVTKLTFAGIERLQKYATEQGVELIPLIIYSPDDSSGNLKIIKESGYQYITTANKPLSNKLNAGVNPFKRSGVNGVIFIGSDNTFCNNYFQQIIDWCKEGHKYVGSVDCYFHDLRKNITEYWRGYTNHRRSEAIGCGRFIHSSLLNQLNWQPWENGFQTSMDYHMIRKIQKAGIRYRSLQIKCKRRNYFLCDFKSGQNLNPMPNTGVIEKPDFLANFLSEKEMKIINSWK